MHSYRRGFTLIELSIVLVIIGLLIGGILVGRDLITAAAIRAQISQVQKYASAANTFRTKYNALPGDIKAADAAAVGLIARAGGIGDGDGNGFVEGLGGNTGAPPFVPFGGETVFFWTDLSSAQLIDGSFSDSSDTLLTINGNSNFAAYLPQAKMGRGAYIMGFSNDSILGAAAVPNYTALVFEIFYSTFCQNPGYVHVENGAITVAEAYAIDSKLDDGLPFSGRVVTGGIGRGGASGFGFTMPGYNGADGFAGHVAGRCLTDLYTPYQYNLPFPDYQSCTLMIGQ